MKRFHHIILSFAAVLCLSSCEGLLHLDVSKKITVKLAGMNTRGSVINIDSLKKTGFILDGFLEKSGRGGQEPHYLANQHFELSGGKWTCEGATWRNKVQTNLWCHYPVTLGTGHGSLTINFPSGTSMEDSQQKTITASYTMPVPATGTTHDDAERTDAILFAYATKYFNFTDNPGADPTVSIAFSNILSAIMFKKGTVPTGYEIKSISLNNFSSTATCTLSASSPYISWSAHSTPLTFTQDVNLAGLEANEMYYGRKVFWVIPQVFTASDNEAVTVVFTKDGKEQSSVLSLGTTEFKPGMQYVYTVSFSGLKAVASLSTGYINFYNKEAGTWDETTDGLDDYDSGDGRWGIDPTVGVQPMTW